MSNIKPVGGTDLQRAAPEILLSLKMLVERSSEVLESSDLVLKRAKKSIENARNNLLWTYEMDGEVYDGDFYTRQGAQRHAERDFAEKCQDQSPANGEVFEADGFVLIQFSNKDDGDCTEWERIEGVLEYEHYHGDHAEHFHQGDYI